MERPGGRGVKVSKDRWEGDYWKKRLSEGPQTALNLRVSSRDLKGRALTKRGKTNKPLIPALGTRVYQKKRGPFARISGHSEMLGWRKNDLGGRGKVRGGEGELWGGGYFCRKMLVASPGGAGGFSFFSAKGEEILERGKEGERRGGLEGEEV